MWFGVGCSIVTGAITNRISMLKEKMHLIRKHGKRISALRQ